MSKELETKNARRNIDYALFALSCVVFRSVAIYYWCGPALNSMAISQNRTFNSNKLWLFSYVGIRCTVEWAERRGEGGKKSERESWHPKSVSMLKGRTWSIALTISAKIWPIKDWEVQALIFFPHSSLLS